MVEKFFLVKEGRREGRVVVEVYQCFFLYIMNVLML